jgi:ABC-2 type transport system permease protein
MSRMLPVLKREFTQAVTSRAFLVGTILGPLLLAGVFAIQFLIIAKSGASTQRVVIVDASGRGMGDRVIAMLRDRQKAMPSFMSRATYTLTQEQAAPTAHDEVRARLSARVAADSLDGFLWIPPEAMAGTGVAYEGSNATNNQVMTEVRGAVQRVVQSERLKELGIDESRLGNALSPVTMDVKKTGAKGEAGSNAMAAKLMAFAMAFAIYIVVIMYGQSIMSSVQEEKRDRVVELIMSSVRAKDVLIGKVLGIGAAGILQIIIWVAAAALLLTKGGDIARKFGASEGVVQALSQQSMLPHVPLSAGIIFILYFAGGFFLFATMFAIIGAIVTTAQEAQQFVFPVLMPFMIGFFMAMPAADNPNSGVAVIGSLVPFTSPMVMPVRATIAGPDWVQVGISLVLLYGTAALIIWLASKIYRTAIFATGKKPTMRELVHWMRAS